MPKLRGFSDGLADDELLLCAKDRSDGFNVYPRVHHDSAVAKGVANQLERWPSHLFFAFLAACLVLTSVILFVFATVAFYLPVADNDRWQIVEESSDVGPPRIYFVKNENRTWTAMDLCYIESAARDNPDLDVYLINVMRQSPGVGRVRAIVIRLLGDDTERAKKFLSRMNYSVEPEPKTNPLDNLIEKNRNIRSVNVPIERLFYRSQLFDVANRLSDETLETATKIYLLWNTPGIALSTNTFCNLNHIRQFLCTKTRNCTLDTLATVDPENEVVATNVPCQAFLGFFIRQLWEKETGLSTHQRYSLKEALNDFCPRIHNCTEVRTFEAKTKCSLDELNCPNVYPEFSKESTETPSVLST